MGADHEAVRARLGRVGVWTFAFDALRAADVREAVAAIDEANAILSLGSPPARWIARDALRELESEKTRSRLPD